MIPLALGLMLANLAFLAAAAALGYYAPRGTSMSTLHIVIGTFAALLACAVHCVVFTYFVATAKWIQLAVTSRQLDPALMRPTRSFKAQALPASLLAIVATITVAAAGAATDNALIPPRWHGLLAASAIVINLLTHALQLRAIARNGRLIDRILELAGPAPTP